MISLLFFLVSVRVLDIHVRSEGCEDEGRADICGKAYIKVNGTDHSPHSRGYNVVVVDGATGTTNYAARVNLPRLTLVSV